MINGLLADHLDAADLDRLHKVGSGPEANFVQLAEIAGLDRRSAWQHLNLAGVDFSDCDLRGFNFTGADLRGCIGSNVLIDSTTILDGADLDASIFELASQTARIFEQYPELQREYRRIRGAYWTDQHNWVCDVLVRKGRNPEARRALALSLFFDTTDPLVRRTILTWLVFKSDDPREAVGFLARFISDRDQNPEAVLAAISFLGSTFRRSEGALLLMFAVAEDASRELSVRIGAAAAVLRSETVTRHMARAFAMVTSFGNRPLENAYIRIVARQLSPFHEAVVGEGRSIGGLNLHDAVSEPVLFRVITGIWATREDPERKNLSFPKPQVLADLIKPVLDALMDLQSRGLPLKLDFDPSTTLAIFRGMAPPPAPASIVSRM